MKQSCLHTHTHAPPPLQLDTLKDFSVKPSLVIMRGGFSWARAEKPAASLSIDANLKGVPCPKAEDGHRGAPGLLHSSNRASAVLSHKQGRASTGCALRCFAMSSLDQSLTSARDPSSEGPERHHGSPCSETVGGPGSLRLPVDRRTHVPSFNTLFTIIIRGALDRYV